MKCQNCGARIKKSEEICPECGKFVSEKESEIIVNETETVNYMQTATSETSAEENEDSAEVFDYKEHILKNLLFYLGIGLFLALILIFDFFDDINHIYFSAKDVYSSVLVIFLTGLSFFRGISTYIQEKKCIITITDEKVYGTIPKGIFDTEDFEVNIADIVCVEKEDFHGRHADPKVIIVTAENRIEIKASSSKLLGNFKNTLQERIVKNEFIR